ncbi:zinc ABC transporter substrate-binding protein [Devosia sp. J2-20]|uniref:zinc ABC transporter substrate-binding protein n=1 Tax=Devosia sp. J2-20 TaxID=3026161 RepID=UPI002499BEBC|nr:zinc ABC transporter substrate-binding protein [Devosia sp. J2-20]WDR00978.1 zinc ABC transporter substrate-binding protein [Devosia sp. J2-20]
MKLLAPYAMLTAGLLTTTAWAAPGVVASIKPVHSLVAAVMEGVGEPDLIVDGSASPHTYALKPSDADALQNADLVFWTGHGLELFLGDALETLSTGADVVELAAAPGIVLLPVREGGAFEAHEHDDQHAHDAIHDHDGAEDHAMKGEQSADDEHGEGDMHFWLDPENAKLMVTQIATSLAQADPANASTYQTNAEAQLVRLDELEAEIDAMLAPVKDKPFIVFHDAYQYFEARFGLNLAGSITVTPDTMPGAARIDELKTRLVELGAACVFAEPNFAPTIINAITEGSAARSGTLDPEGGALEAGIDLYPNLLRGLATSLVDCLG